MSEPQVEYPRPSYESDPARLRARIAILEATPQTANRDVLIGHLRRCLERLGVRS